MGLELTLSELQRRDVWENWLGAEIRSDYFADLAARYKHRQTLLTSLGLVLSSGAVVTILASHHWWALGCAVLATVVNTLSLVQQNQKLITDCSDLSFKWSRLASDYKALWDSMYSDDAPQRYRMLDEKVSEISKSSHGMPLNEKAMLKWQNRVEQAHAAA